MEGDILVATSRSAKAEKSRKAPMNPPIRGILDQMYAD